MKTGRSIITRPPPTPRSRGSAFIEFALVGPLFFLLVVAVFDFSHLLYTQLTLQSAVSEAARFGVTGQRWPDPERPARFLGRGTSLRAVVAHFSPGLDQSRLVVSMEQRDADRYEVPLDPEDLGGHLETLIIEGRYRYPMMVSRWLPAPVTIELYARSAMRNERFAPIGR